MKASRVSEFEIFEAVFGRLQRCAAHLEIWASFEMKDHRPKHFHRVNDYGEFFIWVPDAAAFSFIVRICSLFDTSEDCITLESYAQVVGFRNPITESVRTKIDLAADAVQPLRKVRNAYYAHRLAKGTASDLFEENDLTCDKLFSILELTRNAAAAVCELAKHRLPPLNPSPQKDLARLLADLSSNQIAN
jgi:hypothetical protein